MVINMLVDNDICISSALEDYLESIYEISRNQKTECTCHLAQMEMPHAQNIKTR